MSCCCRPSWHPACCFRAQPLASPAGPCPPHQDLPPTPSCPPHRAAAGSVEPDNFTPARIFTSIAYFALMRFPLIFLPFALVQLSNALVSMRRLTTYFMLEEREDMVEHGEQPGAAGCRGEGAQAWAWAGAGAVAGVGPGLACPGRRLAGMQKRSEASWGMLTALASRPCSSTGQCLHSAAAPWHQHRRRHQHHCPALRCRRAD